MAWIEQTGRASWRVRFRRADGTVGSMPGFSDRRSAESYVDDMETDRRRRVWTDPAGGRLVLRAWVEWWLPVQDLDPRTVDNYESYLRCHILARFGATPLDEITALDVDAWVKEAHEAGYATATVASWVKLLSMILSDAVRQRLISVNPVRQRRRRGRRSRVMVAERVWASPEQVLRIANQAGVLGGSVARLLVITAAWTGCRWGELAALHRDNLDLDAGHLVVDAEVGSLHESRGRRWLGPPKTPSSARTIMLPPFLVRLLRRHLETSPFEFVFTKRVRHLAVAFELRPADTAPGDRRRWQGWGAVVCGPAGVDIPRVAAQPQDVADRRGSARDRTGPTLGASSAEPGGGDVFACGAGGGDTVTGRPAAPLA
jgi:integrase